MRKLEILFKENNQLLLLNIDEDEDILVSKIEGVHKNLGHHLKVDWSEPILVIRTSDKNFGRSIPTFWGRSSIMFLPYSEKGGKEQYPKLYIRIGKTREITLDGARLV